jgi:hypothetical protein
MSGLSSHTENQYQFYFHYCVVDIKTITDIIEICTNTQY